MTSTATPTRSAPRARKPRRPPSYRLTERDIGVVDAIARHRFLSTDQIASLYFPAAHGIVSSQCRARLRNLTAAGFLTRFERPVLRTEGSKPALFGLAAAGLELLISELGYGPDDIDWRPDDNRVSWAFLDHQIMINNVFIAFNAASARVGWTLPEWVDDRILKVTHAAAVPTATSEEPTPKVLVVPDAYFALSTADRFLRFFVEADRATMTVISKNQQTRTWQKRIGAYQDYFDSDLPMKTYGTKRIRVLTVTTSQRRLESLKRATEAAGGKNKYWFTTERDLMGGGALEAPIWYKAGSTEPVSLRQPE